MTARTWFWPAGLPDHGGRQGGGRGDPDDLRRPQYQYRYAEQPYHRVYEDRGMRANELGHPAVLDPVGVGASTLRTSTANELLKTVKFTVIRGNISEIKTLAVGTGTTKGVDADIADRVTEDNLDEAVAFVKKFAERTGAVIAVTGAIDLVADAKKRTASTMAIR